MSTEVVSDTFYGSIPVFRGFASLMDPALYSPLPDDWTIGVADIVESTKAIAQARYKAVNMAGAAVIAAVTNALEGREFPFVFGGDGASFAVSPDDLERAREALAATAAWVKDDLDLVMRVALVPVARDPGAGPGCSRRAVWAVGEFVLCDVFRRRAGLGRSRDEARRVRGAGRAARHAARSHRAFVPVRGNSVSARPHPLGAGGAGARRRSARVPQVDRGHHRAGRAQSGCGATGAAGRAAAAMAAGRRRIRGARRSAADRCSSGAPAVLAHTLFVYLIMRFGIRVGGFVPKIYVQQVVENSDFRKYDDGLRMILDCTPELELALTQRLAQRRPQASRATACTGRTRR